MQIVMRRPVFKCAEDEVIFIARLRELPDFDYLITKEQKLYLNFSAELQQSALAALEEICAVWDTCLLQSS